MQFERDFFEEEVREDFTVSRLRKHIWAAEMELLKIIIDICDRYGLKYFADWGTLLGVVRHKGYVPWDDDIDICMKRDDYNRLIKILPKELPHGVEVLGAHAQKEEFFEAYPDTFQLMVGAVRNAWDINEYTRFFHGYILEEILIDIFPLDVVPGDEKAYQVQQKLFSVGFAIASDWDNMKKEGTLTKRLAEFEKLSGIPVPENVSDMEKRRHMWKMIDAIASLYREGEGENLSEYAFADSKPELILSKDCYRDCLKMPFENMEIAVPTGYDTILKTKYGDYRKRVQGASSHSYASYEIMADRLEADLKRAGITCGLDELCDKVVSGEVILHLT